jgi:hypothetical protein
MVETARLIARFEDKRLLHPLLVGDVDQGKGAVDIGLDEDSRVFDGVVDMAFGGKVDDPADIMLLEKTFDQFTVADIALDKSVARISFDLFEVLKVACIGQQVKVYDVIVGVLFQKVGYKV